MPEATDITLNNSLFILSPHKDKSGGGYMRKYEYSRTEYNVNSKYSKEHTLNELLEEKKLQQNLQFMTIYATI